MADFCDINQVWNDVIDKYLKKKAKENNESI